MHESVRQADGLQRADKSEVLCSLGMVRTLQQHGKGIQDTSRCKVHEHMSLSIYWSHCLGLVNHMICTELNQQCKQSTPTCHAHGCGICPCPCLYHPFWNPSCSGQSMQPIRQSSQSRQNALACRAPLQISRLAHKGHLMQLAAELPGDAQCFWQPCHQHDTQGGEGQVPGAAAAAAALVATLVAAKEHLAQVPAPPSVRAVRGQSSKADWKLTSER